MACLCQQRACRATHPIGGGTAAIHAGRAASERDPSRRRPLAIALLIAHGTLGSRRRSARLEGRVVRRAFQRTASGRATGTSRARCDPQRERATCVTHHHGTITKRVPVPWIFAA